MADVSIRPKPNGPYLIEGPVDIYDTAGNKLATDDRPRIALCRCGASSNKPFCDGTHSQGGQYGVAILSSFPIMATDHRLYKNTREAERRGFIRAEVQVHGRTLNFVTTHLDYQYEDGRVFETEQLLAALKDVNGPLILVGDFNDVPAGGAYKLVSDRFNDAWIDR